MTDPLLILKGLSLKNNSKSPPPVFAQICRRSRSNLRNYSRLPISAIDVGLWSHTRRAANSAESFAKLYDSFPKSANPQREIAEHAGTRRITGPATISA